MAITINFFNKKYEKIYCDGHRKITYTFKLILASFDGCEKACHQKYNQNSFLDKKNRYWVLLLMKNNWVSKGLFHVKKKIKCTPFIT